MGAAILSPSLPYSDIFRLPDHYSIYYAESYAILQGLKLAKNHSSFSFCIISDCFRVLEDIKTSDFNRSPHPDILLEIISLLESFSNSTIFIKWLPSHVSHPFINQIDNLAKPAALSNKHHNVSCSTYGALQLVETWIIGRWSNQWNSNPSSNYQRTFKFHNSFNNKFKSRKAEIISSRFRMLQTRLNQGLHKINLHETGLCEQCGVIQDCEHFIYACTSTEELRKVIRQYKVNIETSSYDKLLTNINVLNSLINFCSKNDVIV